MRSKRVLSICVLISAAAGLILAFYALRAPRPRPPEAPGSDWKWSRETVLRHPGESLPAPEGYPAGRAADEYVTSSFEPDYATRREAYLDFAAASAGGGIYNELTRLERGLPVLDAALYRELREIDERHDCSDFTMSGVLRLLYQYSEAGISENLLAAARQTVLDFKYWPDEPGIDSMCTWSENHHILFSSAGYLAGQLYPDEVFRNSGWTGREQMERHRARVMKWLEMRYRTGFSEWLSNVYYDEDIAALVNLVDFADDHEISSSAEKVLDLLLADIALNSFHGLFGSTHGRSYFKNKTSGAHESTASTSKLLFGKGVFNAGNMSCTALALSTRYRMPQVLYNIANDGARGEMINRQRMGIRIEDAEAWGYDYDDYEDAMALLTMEAYPHPLLVNTFVGMLRDWNWWENDFFAPFARRRDLLENARRWGVLGLIARWYETDLTRNMRPEVNIYTYRTPDYMLSTAQDWRKGYGGDQQQIWQASLGTDTVVFTTHPVESGERSPDYWTGSGSLPRAAQYKNVVLCLYEVDMTPGLYISNNLAMTHAWFPRDRMDQVVEQDGWFLGRKGDGYVALYSSQPCRWQDEGEFAGAELMADGAQNVWICELGRRETDGEFDAFVERITAAEVTCEGLEVRYISPSQGALEFGWDSPLLREGESIPLGDYPRYENPYCSAEFPADRVRFEHGGAWLELNWSTFERSASGFVVSAREAD